MDKDEPNLVERLHREALERRRQEEERGNAPVESTRLKAVEQGQPPLPPVEPLTIHYTELPEAKPDSPLYDEWNTYRREAARLLAEGNAGRHVLIKDTQIIGIWDTHDEAATAGYQRFLGQPFLVHRIQERERVLRCVTERRCRN